MRDRVETELAEMTRWEGDAPGLWERALEGERAGGTKWRRRDAEEKSIWQRPIRVSGWVGGVAAAACLVLVVSVMLPSLGRTRQSARLVSPDADRLGVSASNLRGFAAGGEAPAAAMEPSGLRPSPEAIERQVVRKVTVELAVDDVSAAYMKARRLVSGAHGEFVEESALTGDGRGQGTLTLRVSVERLSEVLDGLRGLGEVTDERSTGEDVTDQVVDLEARIRNEQRVEKELLELMESRTDAPLEDLLRLREEVSRVRVSIERMTAQRERLSRLVSLASVLVIIRAADEPGPGEAGLWGGFIDSLGEAWTGGVRVLGETVAGIVGVLVGGLVWWVLLVVVVVTVRHRLRSMPEPAP